jgi:hypothetical protein
MTPTNSVSLNWRWGVLILAVTGLIVIRPVGFAGGSADDARYLEAAFCWIENGPCFPETHWSARWPVVAPLALSVRLFGATHFSVGIASFLFSLGCLALLKIIGDRIYGRGLQAVLIFAAVPAFAINAFRPSVEPIELFFALGCFAGILWRKPFIAGLALGLAIQTRETAVVLTPFAGLLLWRLDKRGIPFALLGLSGPALIEFATFWLQTGDPLYRRKLSVAHTLIGTTELAGGIGKGLPFFNASNIAHWRLEPGIHIHWLIDGPLNLLFNVKTGFLFLATPFLLSLFRKQHGWTIFTVAALVVLCLVYGLAINPKARMFMVPLALCALLVASMPARPVTIAVLCVTGFASAYSIITEHRMTDREATARKWAAEYPGKIGIEPTVREMFVLSPDLYSLAGTELQINIITGNCGEWATHAHLVLAKEEVMWRRKAARLCLVKVPADIGTGKQTKDNATPEATKRFGAPLPLQGSGTSLGPRRN